MFPQDTYAERSRGTRLRRSGHRGGARAPALPKPQDLATDLAVKQSGACAAAAQPCRFAGSLQLVRRAAWQAQTSRAGGGGGASGQAGCVGGAAASCLFSAGRRAVWHHRPWLRDKMVGAASTSCAAPPQVKVDADFFNRFPDDFDEDDMRPASLPS